MWGFFYFTINQNIDELKAIKIIDIIFIVIFYLPVPSYKPMVLIPNAIPILLSMQMPSFSDFDMVSYLL